MKRLTITTIVELADQDEPMLYKYLKMNGHATGLIAEIKNTGQFMKSEEAQGIKVQVLARIDSGSDQAPSP